MTSARRPRTVTPALRSSPFVFRARRRAGAAPRGQGSHDSAALVPYILYLYNQHTHLPHTETLRPFRRRPVRPMAASRASHSHSPKLTSLSECVGADSSLHYIIHSRRSVYNPCTDAARGPAADVASARHTQAVRPAAANAARSPAPVPARSRESARSGPPAQVPSSA